MAPSKKSACTSTRHSTEATPMTQPSLPALPTENRDTTSIEAMDTTDPANESNDSKLTTLLPSIQINNEAEPGSGSPPWEIEPDSFLARSTVNGTYHKMLKAFEVWKNDPACTTRVAAFMEYGKDVKTMPANFGKHLMYHKTHDMPLHIVFFGEIARTQFGTALRARENHYVGTEGNVCLRFFFCQTS